MSPPVKTQRIVPSPSGYPTIIFIGGIQATTLVRIKNLTITDVLNEQPNTASFTANLVPHGLPSAPFNPPAFDVGGFNTTPTPATYPNIRRGQPVEIYSGGLSPDQLVFGGEIVNVRQIYEAAVPANVALHVSCTDYTRALNRRKVTKSYGTQSTTAIVLDLMASRLADGFTTHAVQAGLPSVAIDFTFEEMNRALTRLANRIGAYWYIDYSKVLHFFLAESGDAPAPLEPGGEPFADLQFETDLSQVRTRVVVEGAGTVVSTRVAIGETIIPVRDPVMFQTGGGLAIIGQQRIAYTGVQAGGQGSLVGPGAQPGTAPTVTAQPGTGIELGAHEYAVTYQSAAGESLPSGVARVTLGRVDAPTAPPTPNPPTAGNGPNPGDHQYAVTFVTSSGETTPSSASNTIRTTQAGGVPAPGPAGYALRRAIGNLAVGVAYAWKTTFLTGSGETLPGYAVGTITPEVPRSLGSASYIQTTSGGNIAAGLYYYGISHIVGGFETAVEHLTPNGIYVYGAATWNLTAVAMQVNAAYDPRATATKLYRSRADAPDTYYLVATLQNVQQQYTDIAADANLGAARPGFGAIGTPPGDQATITVPTSGDARVVGRKLYRSDNGAAFRFLATLNNNTATQYIDNTASVATNADAPTTDTTGGALTCVVRLTDIPIGPGAVTARKLYRTQANSPALQFLTTINNNTATTYTDTTIDSALGAPPPSTNGTNNQQVEVSRIPIGSADVTARKLYRSAANTTQLRLLTTLANNTATTFLDQQSDATLGANVPTVDTSGLQQPLGQVTAGAVTIPVSGTAAFAPAGGFAVVGNGEQVVRYSGVTATALTGIPPTGPGALTSTVPYNSSITVAPALIGVPASGPGAIVARGLIAGEPIHLLIERNDAAAQTEIAAIEGGDGVIEHYIQDRRLSAAGAIATADAELALFSRPEIRVTYTTRDRHTRSGRMIAVNLPAPTNLVGEFLIQRVQLTQFDIPGIPPLRTVAASSTRFSFEDVLRRLELEVYA